MRGVVHRIRGAVEGPRRECRRDEAVSGLPLGRRLQVPRSAPQDAGVDMTTSEPLQLAAEMNQIMDNMEKILAAKK